MQKIFRISFLLFVIAAGAAFFLRLSRLIDTGLMNYEHIPDAVLIIASEGWIVIVLIVALVHFYRTKNNIVSSEYKVLLYAAIALIALMLISAVIGNSMLSVVSFGLMLLFVYYFIYKFIKDTEGDKHPEIKDISIKFIYASLFLLFFASLGVWGLAVLSAQNHKDPVMFALAGNFSLHFLYNGFFTFAVLGLFVKYFYREGIKADLAFLSMAYRLLLISVFPAYLISVLPYGLKPIIYTIAGLSAVLQLFGLFYFFKAYSLNEIRPLARDKTRRLILRVILISISGKFILQLAGILPQLYSTGPGTENELIIAFLYLLLLGFISFSVFFILSPSISETKGSFNGWGFIILASGLFLLVLALLSNVFRYLISVPVISYYDVPLIVSTFLIFSGSLLIWMGQLIKFK